MSQSSYESIEHTIRANQNDMHQHENDNCCHHSSDDDEDIDETSEETESDKFEMSFLGNLCQYHFGTDLLVASWMFLISSASWGFMAIDRLATESKVPSNVKVEQWCQVFSATIFILGSIFLVEGAHPVYMAGPKAKKISEQRASSLPFTRRYFTGTDVLIAAWFFAFCTLPFIILAVYIIIIEPKRLLGYLYLVASMIAMLSMGVWVLGAMPDNVEANDGRGSTLIFDTMILRCCCCCQNNTSLLDSLISKKFNYTDLIIGMWIFFIASLLLLPYGLQCIYFEPRQAYSWLSFIMCVGFLAGSSLMLYTSFPGNKNSTIVEDFLRRASCCECRHRESQLEEEHPLFPCSIPITEV